MIVVYRIRVGRFVDLQTHLYLGSCQSADIFAGLFPGFFETCDLVEHAQTYQILAIDGTFRRRGVVPKGNAGILINAGIPAVAKALVLDGVQQVG